MQGIERESAIKLSTSFSSASNLMNMAEVSKNDAVFENVFL